MHQFIMCILYVVCLVPCGRRVGILSAWGPGFGQEGAEGAEGGTSEATYL